jgi:hypothetical protein
MTCKNPALTVNLGQTLDFIVQSPGKPFWIKRKPETGVGEESPIWANVMENNGTEGGRLRVRFNQSGTYYYISETDARLSGEIVVLTEAKRWPLAPDQVYTVDVEFLIAKASDAVVLIPGDTSVADIASGTNWIFNYPNSTPGYEDIFPPLGYAQQGVKRTGSGALHFDTPGSPDPFTRNGWYGIDAEIPTLPSIVYYDVGVLRAWGGANSEKAPGVEVFPFDDSWTLEFWINFKTFNEDDLVFNRDHPLHDGEWNRGDYAREAYVRLVETEEDYFVQNPRLPCVDCFPGDGITPYGDHYPTNLKIDYHPNLAPYNTDLAYFDVKIWSDNRHMDVPPQFEQKFELPRVVDPQSGERIEETIERNQWHHLAFTKDMERQAFTIYVDGVRQGEAFDPSLGLPMDSLRDDYLVALGGWSRATPEKFGHSIILTPNPVEKEHHASLNGYMDDIRITRGITYRGPSFTLPVTPHLLTP